MIFKETVSSDKLKKIFQFYPYGLFKKDHLTSLSDSPVFDDKLIVRILLLYTPIRSTPNVGVWDVIGNNFGSLESNSGIWVTEDFQDQLLFCGGMYGLLPLLNLIKNCVQDKEQGQKLLHRYLEILVLALHSIRGQPEMKTKFIKSFFLLLEHIPRDFFQIKTIQQLAEIRFSLTKECSETFFMCLVHSADIWINCSGSIQKEFWAFVTDIYQQSPTTYHIIFSIPELIDYTLRLSEIKEGVSQGTPKSIKSPQSIKGYKDDSMKELSLILGVVEKLFIKGGEIISENIKFLTPALTSKASATFKFEILKLLKVLLVDIKEDNLCPSPMTFAEHFIENKGMHILLYLCINSPLDVISMCLKLIDVLSSLKTTKKLSLDKDIIPFLSNIIMSKIKEKPTLLSPSGKSGKKFDHLPKIDEEIEANMASQKEKSPMKRSNSKEDLDYSENLPTKAPSLNKMSTQKFSSMKFGLELDVDEANKGFNQANKDAIKSSPENEGESGHTKEPSKESIASKMRKDMMLDDNLMNQTREVPPGPKSKSVPRNMDFFGQNQGKEETKQPSGAKSHNLGFDFQFKNEAEGENNFESEEEKETQQDLMIESGAPPSKTNIKGVIKKRFAFLDTEEDKEEEKVESQKPKNKLVMNPAATGATEFQSDSSSERSDVLTFKGKGAFKKPVINTEAINEMFSYGGEKGDLLIRHDDEEEENEKFLKELDDIASVCVAAMNRASPDDEIVVEDADDGKEDDFSLRPNIKKKDFMTPQTLRGYTKIEFSKAKIEDDKPIKPYLQQETNVIQEEPSPLATSKSSSSKHTLQTPTSSLALDTPKTLIEKAAIEEFNYGIEALYVSILEWLLNRSPSNLNEPLMIDDSDEIHNPNVLMILFNLVKYSNDLIKQKALQDFQMLAKLNKINCQLILSK